MVKTSFTNYGVAGLSVGVFVTLIILAVYSVPSVYDTTGFENTSFNTYDNLTLYANLADNSTSEVYEVTADKSLFDVLGGIVVDSLNAVKTIINSVTFLKGSLSTMLNGLGLNADVMFTIIKYILSVIGFIIASVFLFRVINKTEDER